MSLQVRAHEAITTPGRPSAAAGFSIAGRRRFSYALCAAGGDTESGSSPGREIVRAIRVGTLHYRLNSIFGDPFLRLLRREVEALVKKKHGADYLKNQQAKAGLARRTYNAPLIVSTAPENAPDSGWSPLRGPWASRRA